MLKHLYSKGDAWASGFEKNGWSCGDELLAFCDKVLSHERSIEDIVVILTQLPKGFIKKALRIIKENHSESLAPSRRPVGTGKRVAEDLGKLFLPWPPTPSPRPHLLPLPVFDEEDPFSQPKGKIAASSSEPIIRESRAFLASNSDDVPLDGNSRKRNVMAPPETLQCTSSSKVPTTDEACAYVLECGEAIGSPQGVL